MPSTSANTTATTSIRTSCSRGSVAGPLAINAWIAAAAMASPPRTPMPASTRLSDRKNRTMSARFAPSARRTVTSRWRPSARTSTRLPMFAHATRSRSAIAVRSTHSPLATDPIVASLSGTAVEKNPLRMLIADRQVRL